MKRKRRKRSFLLPKLSLVLATTLVVSLQPQSARRSNTSLPSRARLSRRRGAERRGTAHHHRGAHTCFTGSRRARLQPPNLMYACALGRVWGARCSSSYHLLALCNKDQQVWPVALSVKPYTHRVARASSSLASPHCAHHVNKVVKGDGARKSAQILDWRNGVECLCCVAGLLQYIETTTSEFS